MMVVEGDRELSYRAPRDGTVYVYDTQDNKMVYSGEIDRDQTIRVDPEADKVEVNGRTVAEDTLDRGHKHRVFFEREDKRLIVERETTIRND